MNNEQLKAKSKAKMFSRGDNFGQWDIPRVGGYCIGLLAIMGEADDLGLAALLPIMPG